MIGELDFRLGDGTTLQPVVYIVDLTFVCTRSGTNFGESVDEFIYAE
jgi:hypothetical protein